MGLALEKDFQNEGVARKDVQASLYRLSKQFNQLEEILKIRYDNEIWKLVQREEEYIKHVEMQIANVLQYK